MDQALELIEAFDDVNVAFGKVTRQMGRTTDFNTQIAECSATTADLLVRQHSADCSLENHVRHTWEKRTLTGVIQLILGVIGVEN